MTWQKMSRRQQDYARKLSAKYGTSISQAAKHIDTYAALDRGEISVKQAEQATGNEITVNA